MQKVNEVLEKCAQGPAPIKNVKRHCKAKLTMYTPAIKEAVQNKKKAFKDWKVGRRPQKESDMLLINKK